jgi:cell division protein FtsQ
MRRILRVGGALVLAASLGALSLFAYRVVLSTPRFAIREVRLPKTRHVTQAELAAAAGIEPGQNILAADLARAQGNLLSHPWIAAASVHRELPSTIVVELREREPALLVELGGLYLADHRGRVFKRADTEETEGLVVVTGIVRDDYLKNHADVEARLRRSLEILALYASRPDRPRLGEVHFEPDGGVVLYTVLGPTALRLGQGDIQPRLQRFDLVWQALAGRQALARAIYLDNPTRPDRVTLKLDPDSGDAEPGAPAAAN